MENNRKRRFCKFCGSEIDQNTKKCTGCGKQFFLLKRIYKNAALIILIVLNIIIITLFVFLDIEYRDTKELLEINRDAVQKHLSTIKELNDENFDLSKKADFLDEHICFTTKTDSGYRYHKYGCYHLDNRDTYYWFIEDARREGYTACLDCY